MDDTSRAFPPWIVGPALARARQFLLRRALVGGTPEAAAPPVAPVEEALPDEELAVRDRKIIELRAHNAELGRRLEEAQRRIAALTRPPPAEPPVQSNGNPDPKANPRSHRVYMNSMPVGSPSPVSRRKRWRMCGWSESGAWPG